jgi:predicted nucleic acid-binding protein
MELESEHKLKYYYDAGALHDEDVKELFQEMINLDRKSITPMMSHLSMGEALGNVCYKKGREQAEAFAALIYDIQKFVKIVGNDKIDEELEVVSSEFSGIGVTDAVHLATAIKYACEVFRTSDDNLSKRITKKGWKRVSERLGRQVNLKMNIS